MKSEAMHLNCYYAALALVAICLLAVILITVLPIASHPVAFLYTVSNASCAISSDCGCHNTLPLTCTTQFPMSMLNLRLVDASTHNVVALSVNSFLHVGTTSFSIPGEYWTGCDGINTCAQWTGDGMGAVGKGGALFTRIANCANETIPMLCICVK